MRKIGIVLAILLGISQAFGQTKTRYNYGIFDHLAGLTADTIRVDAATTIFPNTVLVGGVKVANSALAPVSLSAGVISVDTTTKLATRAWVLQTSVYSAQSPISISGTTISFVAAPGTPYDTARLVYTNKANAIHGGLQQIDSLQLNGNLRGNVMTFLNLGYQNYSTVKSIGAYGSGIIMGYQDSMMLSANFYQTGRGTVIVGGSNNRIWTTTISSGIGNAIIGGNSNSIGVGSGLEIGQANFIGGGGNNTINARSYRAAIVGGAAHYILATDGSRGASFIGGGTSDSLLGTSMNFTLGDYNTSDATYDGGVGNWLFGQFLHVQGKGTWVFGSDNSFTKKVIPMHDQVVIVNEPLDFWQSDPGVQGMSIGYGMVNPHVNDTVRYRMENMKRGNDADNIGYASLDFVSYTGTSPDGHGGMAWANKKVFMSINPDSIDGIHFNYSRTTSAKPYGNVSVDNGIFVAQAKAQITGGSGLNPSLTVWGSGIAPNTSQIRFRNGITALDFAVSSSGWRVIDTTGTLILNLQSSGANNWLSGKFSTYVPVEIVNGSLTADNDIYSGGNVWPGYNKGLFPALHLQDNVGHNTGLEMYPSASGNAWQIFAADATGGYGVTSGLGIREATSSIVPLSFANVTGVATFGFDVISADGGHGFRSSTWRSNSFGQGWNIDYGKSISGQSYAEFDNVTIRQNLSASVFQLGKMQNVGGMVVISDGGELSDSVTTVQTTSIKVKRSSVVANDIVQIKSATVATGLSIASEYWVVSSTSLDGNGDGTINLTSRTGANIFRAGTGFSRVGNTSTTARQGFLFLDASSNPYTPNIDVVKGIAAVPGTYLPQVNSSGDSTANLTYLKARIGNMTGISDADFGGALTGYGIYTQQGYFKGNIFVKSAVSEALQNSTIEIGNITGTAASAIKITNTGTASTSGLFGYTPGSAVSFSLKLDGTANIAGTAFNDTALWSGNGVFADAATPYFLSKTGRLSLGSAFQWNGSALSITGSGSFSGSISATSGTIGAWTIGSSRISSTNVYLDQAGQYLAIGSPVPTAFGTNPGIWIGYSSAPKLSMYLDANNYLQWDGAKLTWKAANSTLDGSGNLTASNVNLSGTITASAGAIGSFTINSTRISSTNLYLDQASQFISMGSTPPTTYGNNVGIWIGYSGSPKMSLYADAANYLQWDGSKLTWKGANSSLDASGNFTASSANISGTVTATAGAVGGFTIASTRLSSTNIYLDQAGQYLAIGNPVPTSFGANPGIWMGWSSAPKLSLYLDANHYLQWDGAKLTLKGDNTTLDASGNLTASSAIISGQITATSGAIGGWAIGSNRLSNTNAYIDNAGQYISFGSTPPTAYGNNPGVWMGYSSGAKISLYNNATNFFQYDGSTVSIAGKFRSNGSTTYSDLSSDTLIFYKASSPVVWMGTNLVNGWPGIGVGSSIVYGINSAISFSTSAPTLSKRSHIAGVFEADSNASGGPPLTYVYPQAVGIWGITNGTGTGRAIGVLGTANQQMDTLIGVEGWANVAGSIAIGVHGRAQGAPTNWAGYFDVGNTYIGGTLNPASPTTMGAGTHGETFQMTYATEELTLSTSGNTTVGTIDIPAHAVVYGIVGRVTQTDPNFNFGTFYGNSSGTAFSGGGLSLIFGETDIGTSNCPYTQGSFSQKVKIVCTGTPAAGKVRYTIIYYVLNPPTS